MSYQVKLEVFEGPFDLLLSLIARRKLDVTEVDLAEITADFLAHLTDQLEDLDLETATRFLVVAATLIELKATRLLPTEDRQELEDLLGEARDVLYARLLEYRAYRDVARILDHRLTQHEGVVAREVPLEPWIQRLTPETPLPIDVIGLAALAAAAMAAPAEEEVDLSYIRRTYLTIRDAALEVLEALPEAGATTSFRALVEDRERGDRVVLFLALLELFKLGHVDLEQPDRTAPLQVERREGEADLADLTDEDLTDGDLTDEERADTDDDTAQGGGPEPVATAGAGAAASGGPRR
jgi:segregation and condensation protein A